MRKYVETKLLRTEKPRNLIVRLLIYKTYSCSPNFTNKQAYYCYGNHKL